MSSESERALSLEELRQRNMPPPTPPPEWHLTVEEWDNLQRQISSLYSLTAAQYDLLIERQTDSTQAQITALTQEVAATEKAITTAGALIQESIQQAGKKKERRFSLPHISLPRLSWAWLMLPAVLVGLAVLWYSSVTILRALGM